jgi:tripartite ATP-independent transporter DctM subunit
MTPTLLGYLGFVALIGLIAFGVPIAWAVTIVAFSGLSLLLGPHQAVVQFFATAYNTGSEFLFMAIPSFILMGQIVARSGIGENLYDTMYKWFGRLPGGLAIASITACTGFGAVTGISSAAVGTMARMVLPEMRRYNYDMTLASGSLASAATIAIMIPPSLLMILYGLWTETSIGKLFVAGLIPGLLTMLVFSAYILVRCYLSPELGPAGPKFSWKERWLSLANLLPVIVIFTLVIGGLYGGWFTPGEAAGVGAAATLAVSVALGRLSWADFVEAVKDTARLSAMIFAILISASVLSRFFVATQVTTSIISWIAGSGVNNYVVLFLLLLLLLFLGCVLDAFGMVLLTLPFIFPIVTGMGFDPIWFGVQLVFLTEIALITPPIGINVFVIAKVQPDIPMAKIFLGALPFVLLSLALVVVFTIFPDIVMWLPNQM